MSAERYLPYDERFRGYGLNKCIHLKGLHCLGYSFYVIPSHFLVAASHERSQAHTQTYGPDSGFRKFVVAATYDRAREELSSAAGRPLASRWGAFNGCLPSQPGACCALRMLMSANRGDRAVTTIAPLHWSGGLQATSSVPRGCH